MTRPTLLLRFGALWLAFAAAVTAAAPPCLDALGAPESRLAGPTGQGCDEGCCDEEGCAPDCSECDCCPVRAPAELAGLIAGEPGSPDIDLEAPSSERPRSRETDSVFRPPRRSA